MKSREKIKRAKSEKIIFSIVFVFLCLHAATLLYAFALLLLNTVKDPTEYALGNTYKLPQLWKWDNYGQVFDQLVVSETGFIGMFVNSFWQTVGGAVLSILSTAMASYAYARYRFYGRKAIYMIAIVLLTLSLPVAAGNL